MHCRCCASAAPRRLPRQSTRNIAGIATAIFWFAVATDLADGPIARRYGEASPLGGLLDHAVDATFCTMGLAAHAAAGVVPWPLPLLVATAFVQYTLDSRSLAGRPLRASRLGRWNGIAYFVAVAVPIVRDTFDWSWPGAALVWWLAAGLVVTTLVSMGDRAIALRAALTIERRVRDSRGAGRAVRSPR